MAQKTVLIKKYENRRLYDATNSRYVNLEDVAQILKSGQDVRVVDVASGADITRLILTQIIVEDAKEPGSDFPLDILRQMVIASGRASQESALNYMNAMLDIYQKTYRAMAPPINFFEFLERAGPAHRGPAEAAKPMPPGREAMEAAQQTRPSTVRANSGEEANELKQRVAELEKMIAALVPRKAARKRPARKRK
jgi:polyhydroxyalkanoate synthesis repressor PhaR